MNLSDAFTAIAVKEIVLVDIPRRGSHQHEINGTAPLKRFFKTAERLRTKIHWHYFSDGRDIVNEEGSLTFYDAREKSSDRTGRSEWRGYYTGDFLSIANPGDILILARTREGELHGMVFEAGSNWLRSVMLLLKIAGFSPLFQVIEKEALQQTEIQLAEQIILDELGLMVPISAKSTDQDLMLKTFGKKIPNTKTLAKFAREQVEVDLTDVDSTLMKWIERETALFFALERVLVQERIDRGFETVEDFLEYSISIQQSRRSRMGLSLQHHLTAVFSESDLKFTAQARTEAKNRPDFLFPGELEYHNKSFDSSRLVMLGAKSTVKERWRQILVEAARIEQKHLCTLEPAISKDQTDEMLRHKVQLVIPIYLHQTYSLGQVRTLWSLRQFVEFVHYHQQ